MKNSTLEDALILVVDDHPTTLRMVVDALQMYGYGFVEAENGLEALNKAQQHLPDLILLDVMLPDLDGYEVCQRLQSKDETRYIPVIFLTALNNVPDKVKGFKSGGVDFLSKPFHVGELLARVESHLTLARLKDDLRLKNAQLQLEIQERQRVELELRNARDNLESQVQLRTAELQSTNRALKRNQARYESMFNYVPVALWEEDFSQVKQHITSLQRQGITDLNEYLLQNPDELLHCIRLIKILDVNQTGLALIEKDRTTVLSGLDQVIGEEAYETFREEFVAFANGQTQFARESYLLMADGRMGTIFVRLTIAPGHEATWSRVLVSIEDISERKAMENALRQSEARLKQAQHLAQLGHWEYDLSTGVIMWSDEMFRLFERDPAQRPPDFEENMVYYVPDDRARLHQQFLDALERGVKLADTYQIVLASGQTVYHVMTMFPVQDARGRVAKLVGTVQDVTQRTLLEQRVRNQERLAAVGQLAAGIAHDFNNILSSITLYTDLLLHQQNNLLAPQVHKRLKIIAGQARRATDLVQQILDFSRRSTLERNPANVLKAVQGIIDILERTLPDHVTINLTYDGLDYTAHIDLTRIQQVLMNLAFNARDAMPDGGVLSFDISSFSVVPGQPIPSPKMTTGEWVHIRVADTGKGIAPEILPHIFEPFFTTKPPGKGTGLGLAQVYGIVTQHEGFITVENAPSGGAVFDIYLPTVSDKIESELDWIDTEAIAGRGEYILVVEDNESTRDALVASLETLHYQVVTAQHGQKALVCLEQASPTFDMVISDMIMPEMGGVELLTMMRQRGYQLPVIILSGHIVEDELDSLRRLGIAGWLTKPPQLRQLATLIDHALKVRYVT